MTTIRRRDESDGLSISNETDQAGAIVQRMIVASSIVPKEYDYLSLSYTGANLTGVVYKLGGAGGTTVATLTLGYTGANLTSVTKS